MRATSAFLSARLALSEMQRLLEAGGALVRANQRQAQPIVTEKALRQPLHVLGADGVYAPAALPIKSTRSVLRRPACIAHARACGSIRQPRIIPDAAPARSGRRSCAGQSAPGAARRHGRGSGPAAARPRR